MVHDYARFESGTLFGNRKRLYKPGLLMDSSFVVKGLSVKKPLGPVCVYAVCSVIVVVIFTGDGGEDLNGISGQDTKRFDIVISNDFI